MRAAKIGDLFYKRYLDDDRCPVVGRFRLIPEEYLPTIERVLRERGLLFADPRKALTRG